MKERFPFREGFEPIVNVGENLCLLPLTDTATVKKYVKVIYIESLPFLEHDFGAVVAGVESDEIEFEELHMNDSELGHFRILPIKTSSLLRPIAAIIFVNNWPALPMNANPCASSSAPGASPIKTSLAIGSP